MGQREKRVHTWLTNPPTDAPIDEVEAILKHYFGDKFQKKSGSHIVVKDARLADSFGFRPNGEFVIAVKGGQRVKGYLLQRLAHAIQIIEEIEEIEGV